MTLIYRIATPEDHEDIHRLNYRTFVEEIPQHAANTEGRLVDRFHTSNTYFICRSGDELVGMVCGRCERPFSLDLKLPDIEPWLPAHARAVEIRLLAIARPWRKTAVLRELLRRLARHFVSQGCDLALISGTVRELKLYAHLGFQPFGPRVGPVEAQYQPMYLTLHSCSPSILAPHLRVNS